MSCKNNPFNPYECELIKTKCLFACEVMKDYKKERYGIKSCVKDLDNDFIYDLLQLLEFNLSGDISSFDKNLYRNKLYLENWLKEMNVSGCLSDFKLLSLNTCDFTKLIEKINSL